MQWTTNVPLIQDGEAVKASVANRSAIALAERTAALQATLSAIQAGQLLVLRNAPVAQGIQEGNVLYLDNNTLLHDLAISGWSDTEEQEGGTLLPLDSSVFTGVVIRKCSDNSADILLGGMFQLESVALNNLFGTTTPTPGIYYLSGTQAGTVTSERLGPSVRVVQYAGDGVVRVFPYTFEPVTHQHYCYRILAADWQPAGNFPDPPVGATYGVDFTTANSVSEGTANAIIGGSGEGDFTVVSTGAKDLSGTYYKDSTGIWTTAGSIPTEDLEYCVTIADTKDMAILHSLISKTEQSLEITNSNGHVVINFKDFNYSADQAGSTVFKGYDHDTHTFLTGDVVEKVVAGPGITMSSTVTDGKGTVQLSASLYNNLRLTGEIVNLNNAVTSVEGSLVVTVMPNTRTSSINYMVQLPEIGASNFTAKIWLQAISPGANQSAPDVSYQLIPTPDEAGVTPAAVAASSLGTFPGAVNAGDIYYLETSDIDLTGYSGGALAFTLSDDTPSPAIQIIAAGIIIADGNI